MKSTALALAPLVCLLAYPAAAQNSTGIGVGVSKSTAISGSRATAISGQGGAGGSVTVAPGAIAPAATAGVTIAGTPAQTANTTTVHNSGSISNVPAVFAPGLSAAGLETCLGSVSVGASWLGTGITGGGSIPDPGCAARLDARTLWSMGLKKAAVARLCLNPDIQRAMPDVCGSYLPQPAPAYAPVGYYAQASTQQGIMLVDGKTGVEHLCLDYAEAKQKCRQWADAAPKRVAAKRRHQDPMPTVAEADQTK